MGLINKIEDKLSSHKDSKDSSKYHDTSSDSSLRHPVSASTGTAGNDRTGYGSSTTGTGTNYGDSTSGGYGGSTTGGYGSSATGTSGGYGTSGTSSGIPGSHHDAGRSGRDRDGYGHPSGGYKNTGDQSDFGVSDRNDRTHGTTTGQHVRDAIDPYSSRGQNKAADAGAHTGAHTGGRDDYSSGTYANDPNVPRTREGGVLNPSSDPASRNPDAIPTAGGHKVGSSNVNDPYSSGRDEYSSSGRNDPYSSSTHHSSGHPIRDIALGGAGGAGAAGAGHAAGRHHGERGYNDPSSTSGGYGQDSSYGNRSGEGGAYSGSNTVGGGASGLGGSSGGVPDSKKVAGAYEAGYRDAIEHAKAEQGRY